MKSRAHLWLCAAIVVAAPATAADFRSIGEGAAVLFDAPSLKAKKTHVIGRGYPVEIVVTVEGWVKVRDINGDLTWIENKNLTDRRTVMVKVPLAQVRQSADDNAPVVFQAQQNVILDLVEATGGGWLRVKHRDGQTGFVKASQVWGA